MIFLIAGLGSGMGIGFGLTYPSLEHEQGEADYWQGRYNELYDDFTDLFQDYGDLLNDYNTLNNDYNDLFGQYQSILSVLEDPLTSPVLPTLSEVQTWLYYDDTDSLIYNNITWMCGDFSAMLMVRAKEMNWRMRIAVVSFSESTDPNYGIATPFGAYGHAFNLIYVQDIPNGDIDSNPDVLYIEPQTDNYWAVPNFIGGSYLHYWHWVSDIWRGTTWIGGLSPNSHWINYYNYFA